MNENDPLAELQARGLIAQVSDEGSVRGLFAQGMTTIYVGFDPTATSLHVGHLLPVMVLAQLQRMGHRPIILVGGATGMIGDPSGKTAERELLTPERVQENVRAVHSQLERFVEFNGDNGAVIVNNGDWILPMTFVDFLREVGKYFTVNYMIAKESVRKRLEDREQGISYTEFSYMLMQAFDFLHLFDEFGCCLQGGGNDQWGNITAGIELIRKTRQAEAFGITFPLLTTAGGEKFGKSEGNAIWLDPELTSPFKFFQYWIQTDDRDVERLLKCFTFLSLQEISEVMAKHLKHPEHRTAQKALAREITRTVHGDDGLARAERASVALFGGNLEGLSPREVREVFASAPSCELARQRLGSLLVDLLAEVGTCKSKGEARRLIQQGGLYVNGKRVGDPAFAMTHDDLLSGALAVVRIGKKKHVILSFEGGS